MIRQLFLDIEVCHGTHLHGLAETFADAKAARYRGFAPYTAPVEFAFRRVTWTMADGVEADVCVKVGGGHVLFRLAAVGRGVTELLQSADLIVRAGDTVAVIVEGSGLDGRGLFTFDVEVPKTWGVPRG